MATRKSDGGDTTAKKTTGTTKKRSTGSAAGKAATTRKKRTTPAAKKATSKKTPAAKKAATTKAATTRKKVAHRPAPAAVPGRKERRGVVVSDAMDKTIVVRIDVVQKHEVYGKVVRRSTKVHAHDEHNDAHEGDLVRVAETRPLSATKRWRLLEVLEKAK